MRILLPPSEGKTAPQEAGAVVDTGELLLPELAQQRRQVAAALANLCRDEPQVATRRLKLGKKLGGYLETNQCLWEAPIAPAHSVYTGVLFDSLRLPELPSQARDKVVICSGLWGAISANDAIPDYRCPAGTRLAVDGERARPVSAFWRPWLDKALPQVCDGEFTVDLRSQDYRAMWSSVGATAAIRVWHEKSVDGEPSRTLVGHFNKATKGRLAAELLASGAEPGTKAELADTLRDLDYRVESPVDAPEFLDVIRHEL